MKGGKGDKEGRKFILVSRFSVNMVRMSPQLTSGLFL